jgi:DmsE family decaheme c-type cytochrome
MPFRVVLASVVLVFLGVLGCESLKSSKPIGPIREYEKLLVGRLDANYVGNNNCLASCHFHDKIRRDFEASTMGAQLSSTSGMPLVDCESCHGPGSLAIQGLDAEKVAEDGKKGVQTECDNETFIDIKELPPTVKSLMCLKCHTANATFNLHNWNSGLHAIEGVSCLECHNVHAGPDLIVSLRETKDMCYGCHQKAMAEFSLISHHPVREEKVFCTDCHDAHGTFNEAMLREETMKDTCTKCHAEKEGPFIYDHAGIIEDCLNCHKAHGSANYSLLLAQETYLCMQCHPGHRATSTSSAQNQRSKGVFYTRCTDCHSETHGTDLPSPSGRGMFIN